MPDAAAPRGALAVANGLGAAEVHAHTTASDGMVSPRELVAAAAAVGLAVLCITDHDTMNGVAAAVDAGHRLGVDVVGGQEITCAFPANTHVIGLFHDRPVRMGMSLEDTVDAVHDHGGLAILAHPFMPTFFASAGPRRIRRLLEHRRVDGVELRHRAPMGPWGWDRLDAFYAGHREALGAALGAGDSHFGSHDLGRLVTVFPGRSGADLRRAIESCATSPLAGPRPSPPTMALRLRQQQRSLVWLSQERRAGRVGGGAGPLRARVVPPLGGESRAGEGSAEQR
ncbi:MAG: PHP domain-containing protein [Candidatus Dormibacteria bacterium]